MAAGSRSRLSASNALHGEHDPGATPSPVLPPPSRRHPAAVHRSSSSTCPAAATAAGAVPVSRWGSVVRVQITVAICWEFRGAVIAPARASCRRAQDCSPRLLWSARVQIRADQAPPALSALRCSYGEAAPSQGSAKNCQRAALEEAPGEEVPGKSPSLLPLRGSSLAVPA